MKIISILLSVLIFGSCQNKSNGKLDTELINNPISANETDVTKLPDIKFENDKYDFGIINKGESKSTEFKFTNTGNSDLIIEDAKGSCGCTVPIYPKEPIKPGAAALIKVTFNSEGKHGIQNKSVTLITNCIPSTKFLSIKANVIDGKN